MKSVYSPTNIIAILVAPACSPWDWHGFVLLETSWTDFLPSSFHSPASSRQSSQALLYLTNLASELDRRILPRQHKVSFHISSKQFLTALTKGGMTPHETDEWASRNTQFYDHATTRRSTTRETEGQEPRDSANLKSVFEGFRNELIEVIKPCIQAYVATEVPFPSSEALLQRIAQETQAALALKPTIRESGYDAIHDDKLITKVRYVVVEMLHAKLPIYRRKMRYRSFGDASRMLRLISLSLYTQSLPHLDLMFSARTVHTSLRKAYLTGRSCAALGRM